MPIPVDGGGGGDPLPAALEERIAQLESGGQCGDDFDAASVCWLVVLGILAPLGLLVIGWWR